MLMKRPVVVTGSQACKEGKNVCNLPFKNVVSFPEN